MGTRICRECGKRKPLEAFELATAKAKRADPPRKKRGGGIGIGVSITLGELEYPVCRECVGRTT